MLHIFEFADAVLTTAMCMRSNDHIPSAFRAIRSKLAEGMELLLTPNTHLWKQRV